MFCHCVCQKTGALRRQRCLANMRLARRQRLSSKAEASCRPLAGLTCAARLAASQPDPWGGGRYISFSSSGLIGIEILRATVFASASDPTFLGHIVAPISAAPVSVFELRRAAIPWIVHVTRLRRRPVPANCSIAAPFLLLDSLHAAAIAIAMGVFVFSRDHFNFLR